MTKLGSDLKDYSLIGNCRSAALVSRHGSIDWCCLPEFDSPAIFSALLDSQRGGNFSVTPIGDYNSFQNYAGETNVLETTFITNEGKLILTDSFVALTEEEKTISLFPDHEILRFVHCSSGSVQVKLNFEPTHYFGREPVKLTDNKHLGIKFTSGENSYMLLSTLSPDNFIVEKNKASSCFLLVQGDTIVFSFSCSTQSPAILPELKLTVNKRLQQTLNYWTSWMSQCSYKGMFADQVRRSALVLKLLAHAPTGAIIAAPTTSIPEAAGGDRNWDYRYCWLRDASFTVRVLIKLGFHDEAHAYMNWILHATQLTRPGLQVLYSVFGEPNLPEKQLQWLTGYKGGKPVRIGNNAHDQLQLDVYGEVLDAFFTYAKMVGFLDRSSKRFLMGLGDEICKTWLQPDNGIWEIRSTPAHHTHSKVMAWVGLDRLIKLCNQFRWHEASINKYEREKREIQRHIEYYGYNKQKQSYTSVFKGDTLDAACLVFPLVGYCEAKSPNMQSTILRIVRELSENGLIYRYRNPDGLKSQEGAFGICNFWLVENLAMSGKIKEAITLFQTILNTASPNGLLAEEIDTGNFELMGNYPQGFTHIGLINAALSINQSLTRKDQPR